MGGKKCDDFPNYSFIFSNTEPLEGKIKNTVCYSLITMLYLDIKKDKEEMKASVFQQDIGGVDYLIRRIMNDTKCCGQLSPSDTFFTDI